jgi:hypothetical protein
MGYIPGAATAAQGGAVASGEGMDVWSVAPEGGGGDGQTKVCTPNGAGVVVLRGGGGSGEDWENKRPVGLCQCNGEAGKPGNTGKAKWANRPAKNIPIYEFFAELVDFFENWFIFR